MNELALSAIECFAGVGMLGEGLRAGLEYLGIPHRTVCYVEREAHAASVMVARMEEGSLDAAPVWSDITTFPAGRFRGKVDFVVAGFPCQDLSVAGKQVGLDGARSGLFFNTVDVAEACGAWGMLLENVAGIFSANASVMDETDGFLFERACARVVGELSDRGWNAEWITVSAADVGANHGRARWFCIAWRMGHPGLQHINLQQRADGAEHSRTSHAVDDASRHGRDGLYWKGGSRRGVCEAGVSLELAEGFGNGSRRVSIGDEPAIAVIAGGSGALAYPDGIGRRSESDGELESVRFDWSRLPLFAPGPASPDWQWILDASPWLAPALESDFCILVNGLAFDMGDSRAARLKCVGNGVVALSAAVATVVLARRAGIFE